MKKAAAVLVALALGLSATLVPTPALAADPITTTTASCSAGSQQLSKVEVFLLVLGLLLAIEFACANGASADFLFASTPTGLAALGWMNLDGVTKWVDEQIDLNGDLNGDGFRHEQEYKHNRSRVFYEIH